MFDYAFKDKVKPANEEMGVVADTEDQRNRDETSVSSGAIKAIRTSALYGIVYAFADRMALAGVPKEEISEKIGKFIDQCVTAGDFSKESAKYIRSNDWYNSISTVLPTRYHDNFCMYQYEDNIIEEALGTRTWVVSYGVNRDELTENEKAILDNYEKARKAYWEAEGIRHQYFYKKSRALVHDLLIKYGEILATFDNDLYCYLTDRLNPAQTSSQEVPEGSL